MAKLGYKPGPADGVWGPRSERAYAAFLRDAGLPSGKMLTLDALRAMRGMAGKEKAPGAVAKVGAEASEDKAPSTGVSRGATTAGSAQPTGTSVANCDNWNSRIFFREATPEVVKACLDSGVDSNARDGHGNTPLHRAAGYNKMPAVVAALIEAGADPNAENRSLFTPLHLAARYNENLAVVAALLKAGADPNARNRDGKTPEDLALLNKHFAVLAVAEVFAAGSKASPAKGKQKAKNPGATRAASGPAPKCAAWNNGRLFEAPSPELVTRCLRRGADPKAKDKNGRTPLHWAAARSGNSTVIDVLVNAGADLGAEDQFGGMALDYAAYLGNTPATTALVKAVSDAGLRKTFGVTPLHEAVLAEEAAAVSSLLNAGADPNARYRNGATPLHWAAPATGNPTVIDALKGGADPEARDKKGETPLHWGLIQQNPRRIGRVAQGRRRSERAGREPRNAAAQGCPPGTTIPTSSLYC